MVLETLLHKRVWQPLWNQSIPHAFTKMGGGPGFILLLRHYLESDCNILKIDHLMALHRRYFDETDPSNERSKRAKL
jgi:hypothetical protein